MTRKNARVPLKKHLTRILRDQTTTPRRQQKMGYYARNADSINQKRREQYAKKKASLDHENPSLDHEKTAFFVARPEGVKITRPQRMYDEILDIMKKIK